MSTLSHFNHAFINLFFINVSVNFVAEEERCAF